MGKQKDLKLYSMARIKHVCELKGLVPGRVKSTPSKIQFTRGSNERLEIIPWDDFEKVLADRNLEVWGTDEGWMKIFSKDDKEENE